MWRTNGITHDKRRTQRARKRAESEHRPGGAFGNRAFSRQGGIAVADASAKGIQQGEFGAFAALKESSWDKKSMLLREKWLHVSAADRPSGRDSPHTWHGSPHPSGSSEQRQIMRPQHMAANAMQPMATSATKFLKLSFAFTAAYYSTNVVVMDYGKQHLHAIQTGGSQFLGRWNLHER